MHYTNDQIKDGLLRNDPEIFRYLYRLYGKMIFDYVRKNNGSDTDAREMIQIILLEVWQAVKDGRYQEHGKFDRYVYMLTSNTWRDELRRRKVRRTSVLVTEHTNIIDERDASLTAAIVKDQRIEAIHHCLKQLESPCDEMIRLFHLQEISLQQMATEMAYDYNNLRKRIFDCRKKLKKLVDDFLQKSISPQTAI